MNGLWLPLFGFNHLLKGWLPVALGIGSMVTNMLGGNKKQNREAQNAAMPTQNQQELDRYRAQQQSILQALLGQSNEQINQANVDLRQRDFALNAPSVRGKQALLGSLMQNMQPVSFSGLSPQLAARMPKISGGLNPAAIGPLARQMGLLMQQNALSGQRAGDKFAPLLPTDFKGGLLPPPQLQRYQGPGKTESILGLLGMGLGIAGSLAGRGEDSGEVNNSMPNPYQWSSNTGSQTYGMPAGWRLPRGVLG